MKVQSKKFVKPSTPTPPNLRTHEISFIDEQAPKMYVPLILYYPAPPNANNEHLFSSACNQLEKSLAQTLVQFYPLAGRYKKEIHIVDCNDEGVEFVEANVDIHLHEILAKRDPEQLDSFIPREICTDEEVTDPLLAIQVTVFKCGGFALGVCISHRIADASTLGMFLYSWASESNNQQFKRGKEICPIFDSASFFPGRNYTAGINLEGLENIDNVGTKIVTRRLLFDSKAISSLRATSSPGPNDKPKSKVQLVNAVLWKAIASVESSKDEHSRADLILQPVNLREKTIHQVPKNCCGNLCLLATVPVAEGEKMEIHDLADRLSGSIKWSSEEWTKIVTRGKDDPFLENLMRSLVNYYMVTSWCRFPFYEADFGWGKPAWASSVNLPFKNWIFLMDDKNGDGIEVWVNLDKKDMLVFERACDIQALGGASARIAQNHPDR